jgi:hypothetical protein
VRRRLARAALALSLVAALAAPGAGAAPPPRLDAGHAKRIFLADAKVEGWLRHYPRPTWVTDASFRGSDRTWEVSVYSGRAGEVATGRVDDDTGVVVEAWTGPQVAWPLARGPIGRVINHLDVWLVFCAVFLLGLGNLRRPFCLRNLDLLAVLSFSVPLWYFNHGHVFAGVTLTTFPLLYLLARCTWIGARDRGPGPGTSLPVWVLVGATLFLVGFRVQLNHGHSGILDVGYAGVIGADRIDHGTVPYGHFPVRDTGKPCGPADAEGTVNDWVQSNGRCESATPTGDTYGPVSYLSYLPGLWLFGWSGRWDSLPAVHFTTLLFDVLALLGLAAVGCRYGGVRLAAVLALAWAACPFTQYVSSSNTNDAIMPAFLVWGFWLATWDAPRGVFTALASWTKLAALIVVPLWLTYPEAGNRPRAVVFGGAFLATTALSFCVLLLGGHPLHDAHVFYDRTFKIQFDRHSPFSLWDWGQYHINLPDLRVLQHVLQVVLVLAAIAVAFVPRRKSPLQLAAFTGALLVAFELLLTHWSPLYISWFFPFVALAVLAAPELAGARAVDRPREELSSASPGDAAPASSPVPAAASDA